MFSFSFRGGVVKPSEHTSEKFLLFFLMGDQEVPMYTMLKEGFASRVEDGTDKFVTTHNVCKLFVSQQGFGIQKRFHSFYIKMDSTAPTLEILPYAGRNLNFFFKAQAKIMERKEVLELLPNGLESKGFYERQEVLPLNLYERMVHIDRSALKKGVRQVQVGKKS